MNYRQGIFSEGGLTATDQCYTWAVPGQWSASVSLVSPRAWSASTLRPGPAAQSLEMIIIGGVDADNNTLDTVEILTLDPGHSSGESRLSDMRLPAPVSGHCAVQINSTHTFIAGHTCSLHALAPITNVLQLLINSK